MGVRLVPRSPGRRRGRRRRYGCAVRPDRRVGRANVELRHLRYFVAIAEERSFTRAAERLWVAQPGLSAQIRRLAAELGARLFERHSRGVELPEAGTLFLERARATLTAADAASSIGPDLKGGVTGTLRVGL